MKRYENFVGLTEVKAAQRRVVEVTHPVWHSNCKSGSGRQTILISKGNQNFGQKVQIAHFVKRGLNFRPEFKWHQNTGPEFKLSN